ncbi:hypothetical protein CPB84DRAFT_941093 [Gymnopilus junonius]|uniref:Uncharacterized protein n=1 Tax=Gymnopilus junonius TaxID=109634 RepID=A0A9P5NXD9_GYMJU|nr:hypothetical protein CPB84DRAFT_941093 [Gymnopilus junonius]
MSRINHQDGGGTGLPSLPPNGLGTMIHGQSSTADVPLADDQARELIAKSVMEEWEPHLLSEAETQAKRLWTQGMLVEIRSHDEANQHLVLPQKGCPSLEWLSVHRATPELLQVTHLEPISLPGLRHLALWDPSRNLFHDPFRSLSSRRSIM